MKCSAFTSIIRDNSARSVLHNGMTTSWVVEKKLARGVSDGSKLDGYLALTARFATVECGTSETPIFLRSLRSV